ncbi:MAG: NAD+ synthase [Deltaproteobacteria bacterium]|nr:MAG: NAD+ synthase [Deltaproteobacteria bacterium]
MRTIRIALAQINTTVGDLEGNAQKIVEEIQRAREMGVDLLAFPELAITGYPPEDLLLMPRFVQQNLEVLRKIVETTRSITVLVGFINKKDDIYNAAALIHDGELVDIYHKMFLPNYGVFDEDRYFQAGKEALVFELNGVKIGVSICEDIWHAGDPLKTEALLGDAEIVVNISASPFYAGKRGFRQRMISTRASDNAVIIAYVNLVGGQDELVFDGNSIIVDQKGELIAQAHSLEEDFLVADLDIDTAFMARLHDPRRRKEKLTFRQDHIPLKALSLTKVKKEVDPPPALEKRQPIQYDDLGEVYRALVLGTHDYVYKNNFQNVLIGLSGGIDSSLVAAVAVDALGKENVTGVAMPSLYTTKESLDDAQKLADNLGIKLLKIPISSIFNSYLETLGPHFQGMKEDATEENIQARIRGNILMALSNKFGSLVLTTGNKSELSMGYCTLYGDMAGGFAVIKDCPKTLVYQLADYKNKKEGKEVIPARILQKEPSAELRPNQKDSDTLPPYNLLDPILQAYVEEDKVADDVVALGFSKEMVKDVIDKVDRNEYKRRQAPPGIKITPRALGKDRRLPITNRYRNF